MFQQCTWPSTTVHMPSELFPECSVLWWVQVRLKIQTTSTLERQMTNVSVSGTSKGAALHQMPYRALSLVMLWVMSEDVVVTRRSAHVWPPLTLKKQCHDCSCNAPIALLCVCVCVCLCVCVCVCVCKGVQKLIFYSEINRVWRRKS